MDYPVQTKEEVATEDEQSEILVANTDEPTKETWLIPEPPKEVPEEFTKVVKEYFSDKKNKDERDS